MRCPYHLLKEVAGYCSVCGAFGCSDCLTMHDGELYCRTHYKPIAEDLEKQRKHEELKTRPERQRLVVRLKEGVSVCGICFAMNPKSDGFHLDEVDKEGEPVGKTRFVPFEDLKAVFYVKSFDGKFDPELRYKEWHPQGNAVVVEFEDGEVLEGHTFHPYRSTEVRFHLIPDDPNSNNISILVEKSAIRAVMTPEEYRSRRDDSLQQYLDGHKRQGHSREELTGDFFFEQHDYSRAAKHYREARNEAVSGPRVRKKLSSAHYNIGVRLIKQHEYAKALTYMKAAVEDDPENERAEEKYNKLKRHLKKRQHREPTGTSNTP